MTTIKPHKAAMETAEEYLGWSCEGSMGEAPRKLALALTEAYAPLVEAAKQAQAVIEKKAYPIPDRPDSDWAIGQRLLEALRAIVGD